MAIGIQDQYFGTEIEMTGITRQRAAEKVAELFGTRAVCDGGYYGVWSVTDQEGKKWKFMYDGSIYTERRERGRMVPAGREYSTEMVSPKLSYGEMGKLQEVVRCLRHHGAKVNASCGQHVHVDASNHTPRSLKNAMTIMYSKEDIRQNGRRMKEPEEPMFTITATDRHGVAYRGRIRKLVPRECLRLQGFYDWQIDRIEQDTSDSQLYKQAGNGVTVNVIEAIGTLLRQADAEIRAEDEKTKR